MQVQGQGATQVCLLSGGRGEGLRSDILQGELRKIKPPTFNGEHRKGEEVEAWLLEMKKYFQLHDYPSRVFLQSSKGSTLTHGSVLNTEARTSGS
jgi:hypothetical protein